MPRPPIHALLRRLLCLRIRTSPGLRQISFPERRPFHHLSSCLSSQVARSPRTEQISEGQRSISIVTPLGIGKHLSLLWLRDHCHCQLCVNQDTMQRSFDIFSLQADRGAQYTINEDGLTVKWHDAHVSNYSWQWLLLDQQKSSYNMINDTRPKSWNSEIREQPPSIHYDQIMANDAGVGKWTSKIVEYGFCFVDGCPVSPEKTQKLLERIAFIRTTHYGGFYDFTSDLNMKDTAYTSLALPAHTDNAYFTDPSGLQMFHLLSHTSGSGGESLLVDGFHCAELLYLKNPEAFDLLSKVPVRWHASGNEGISITPAHRVAILNVVQAGDGLKRVLQVRWNEADRGRFPMLEDIDDWYEAARLFNSIITDKKNEYWEQLRPGRPLIFDNWRVLHGRSAFTGKRRMCGGYINRDDYMSRFWNTNFTKEEVLSRVV